MGRTLGPALLIGLVAFALTVEWRANGRAQAEVVERREALAAVVEARQRSIAGLEERLAKLRERFDAIVAGSGQRELQQLRQEATALASLSGASPARGPGLIVRLADAEGATRADPADADFLIQDVDLQAVVNALWAAGAEGIAVDGQRIVSTSAIRNAGAVVRLNYKVLTSPYHVEAIGDPEALRGRFERSGIARRFREWKQIYGLGFSVATSEDMTLASFSGSIRFTHARPVEEG